MLDPERLALQTTPTPAPVGRIQLKPLALPTEHGGWGLLAEPVALGLLAAPSMAALGVGWAAIAAFLAHQPLKLVLADWLRHGTSPRTPWALGYAVAYGIMALGGLALASQGAAGWWIPLAGA